LFRCCLLDLLPKVEWRGRCTFWEKLKTNSPKAILIGGGFMSNGKYVGSFLLLLAGAAFLFPRGDQDHSTEHISAAQEYQMKQAVWLQDMQLTDELCRNQCSISFRHTLQMIAGDASHVTSKLMELQREHPHMQQLMYVGKGQTIDQSTSVGQIDSRMADTARSYLEQANASAHDGSSYHSPPLQFDGHTYFVLGEPSTDGSALVGVVQQKILKEVAEHQRNNLRLVPYPADNNYKIESVEPGTLKDIHVDHPEELASHYRVNEVIVKFRTPPSDEQLQQIKAEIDATGYRKVGYTYLFDSRMMDAKALMNYFKKWQIDYAEPHYLYMTNDYAPPAANTSDAAGTANSEEMRVEPTVQPNDVLYSRYQWNLPLIETAEGWNVTKGSEDVIVAVIDTGADLSHPDLQNQLVEGINIVNPGKPPQDDVGHGTHVAGIISALVNNNLGVAGMTWYNRIMPVKVLDQTGAGSTYSVAQGIIWATDHGAKVINMSLGNYASAQFLHDAIKYAYDHDVVLIAASGNDNTERPGFPAAYPEVFSVAATDSRKMKASFSNYGDYIDVAAPGVSIASTYPHNQYAALSGTSMASPHVTALAALIRSANPSLKNTEVMDIMRSSAQDIGTKGKDKYFGYGLIDVVQSLKSANDTKDSLTLWPQWTQRLFDQISNKFY
jgi:thermitase